MVSARSMIWWMVVQSQTTQTQVRWWRHFTRAREHWNKESWISMIAGVSHISVSPSTHAMIVNECWWGPAELCYSQLPASLSLLKISWRSRSGGVEGGVQGVWVVVLHYCQQSERNLHWTMHCDGAEQLIYVWTLSTEDIRHLHHHHTPPVSPAGQYEAMFSNLRYISNNYFRLETWSNSQSSELCW